MQARLAISQFPSVLFATVFALVAALVLGGVLGYALKPVVLVPGRTQVLVVDNLRDANANADACIWINGHKAC